MCGGCMKSVKLDDSTKAILIVEKGDRFVVLDETTSAILIDMKGDGSDEAKLTTLFPENLTEGNVPFSVTLAACVRVFLDDAEWVQQAHKRIESMPKDKEQK